MISDVKILYGGDLSSDIADQLSAKLSESLSSLPVKVIKMTSTKEFKALTETATSSTLAVFITQTIEQQSPPEDAGACIRFFMRKTHPDDMLKDKFTYAVLGLGDSNLLLDRQNTGAKDCNQVAQSFDARLEVLGCTKFCERGEADERTELTEVEPWLSSLVEKVKESRA